MRIYRWSNLIASRRASPAPSPVVALLHLRRDGRAPGSAVRLQRVGLGEGRPHVAQREVRDGQPLVFPERALQHVADVVQDVDRRVQPELPPLKHHHRHHRDHHVRVDGHVVVLHRLEDGAHAVARARRALREPTHRGGDVSFEPLQVQLRAQVGRKRDDLLRHPDAVPVDDGLEKLRQRRLLVGGELGGEPGVENDNLGLHESFGVGRRGSVRSFRRRRRVRLALLLLRHAPHDAAASQAHEDVARVQVRVQEVIVDEHLQKRLHAERGEDLVFLRDAHRLRVRRRRRRLGRRLLHLVLQRLGTPVLARPRPHARVGDPGDGAERRRRVLRRRRAERVHQERRDGHAGLERLDEHLLRG
mmetsp:Transcript_11908/g.49886  ORF Transcript_11908/g.49886 Transcript_11908/m.49886 type:complete len:360 (-) Transcript_11908:1466-2545(-)